MGEQFFQHTVSNHLVLASTPTVAVTETYYHARLLGADGKPTDIFGRYIDRFEFA